MKINENAKGQIMKNEKYEIAIATPLDIDNNIQFEIVIKCKAKDVWSKDL